MREATGLSSMTAQAGERKSKGKGKGEGEGKGKGKGKKSAALSIRGSGHQALCDVPLLHAPWTNNLVRQTFDGATGLELSKSVNSVVVGFLGNCGLLKEKYASDLSAVPGVFDLEEAEV